MPVRSCRVTIRDMEGACPHRRSDGGDVIRSGGAGPSAAMLGRRGGVKVSVADVRIEHEVKLMEFTKWLERDGASPRDTSDRKRIRAILGMSTPRSNQPAGSPFPGPDGRDTNRKR